MKITALEAQDVIAKWRDESRCFIHAFLSAGEISGYVIGHVYLDEQKVVIAAPCMSAEIKIPLAEVVSFEYVDNREWNPPPENQKAPLCALTLQMRSGNEVVFYELDPEELILPHKPDPGGN